MKRTSSLFALVSVAALAVDASAQNSIPNPLVRPPRASQQPLQDGAAAQPGAPQSGAASRGARTPGRSAAPGARGSDASPEVGAQEKDPVAERLESLYVVAVIGDVAVLRSLRVDVVPPMGGTGLGAGGAVRAGMSGEGGAAGAQSTQGGGSAGSGNTALRSTVLTVRNGEIVPFMERMRVLARVRSTSVTLYDVTDTPLGSFDPLDLVDRGFPVVFRGSLDSVQVPAYVPAGSQLERPNGGLDGAAASEMRDTKQPSSSSSSNRSATGSSPSGLGSTRNDPVRTP
ncbi:MAG: hypothetical protein EBR51_06505 [Gammaproteobacteria bacterium]|jgi:hypothetical protein|nr:hypothetical protein [Gammaproteobacteria bacterium]